MATAQSSSKSGTPRRVGLNVPSLSMLSPKAPPRRWRESIAFRQPELYGTDPLWFAVRSGNLFKLEQALHGYKAPSMPGSDIKSLLLQRGPEGETILHTAILFIDDGAGNVPDDADAIDSTDQLHFHQDTIKDESGNHRAVARYIVRHYGGDLINQPYLGFRYYGEMPLHLAVVKNDLNMTRFLVRHGANINCDPVSGYEFDADDAKSRKCSREYKSGYMYYGGTVLSFAAVSGHSKIVQFLLDNGADPCKQDYLGNTVMHVLAYWGLFTGSQDGSSESCWSIIDKHCAKAIDPSHHPNKIRNHFGQTPFLVGIDRGHKAVLDLIKVPLWKFGMCSSYMFPVDEIDTWRDPMEPSSHFHTYVTHCNSHKITHTVRIKSALEIAIENEDTELLMHPALNLVLRVKWEKFVKRYFLADLILYLVTIVCITLSIAFLPSDHSQWTNYSINPYPRLILECGALAGATIMVLKELAEMYIESFGPYWSFTGWTENLSTWVFVASTAVVGALRYAPISDPILHAKIDTIAIGILAFLGWMLLLYFAKGFPKIGTLAIIFFRNIFHDVLSWLCIYSIFLLAFAQTFYLQMRNSGMAKWNDYLTAHLSLFEFLFGLANFDDFQQSDTSSYTIFVYFMYQLSIAIMLMNSLYAMVNSTFSQIYDDAAKQWHYQWSTLIVQQDRRIPNLSDQGESKQRFFLLGYIFPGKHRLGTTIPSTQADGSMIHNDTRQCFIVRERLSPVLDSQGKADESKPPVLTPVKVIVSEDEYRIPARPIEVWNKWVLSDAETGDELNASKFTLHANEHHRQHNSGHCSSSNRLSIRNNPVMKIMSTFEETDDISSKSPV
ncbi:uncharacterized protein BJ171DRAFT_257310 [Polychytrium aggregatum]|uniref:uncharacterized protein n=1 Tax=Polychytrium aggregatum TaxID=110093 RepID=UPI0022FDF2A9|nr:uncharacterized protein BJ171DRAFT_257310 [Polychytrium aggregatum]KAI9207913.1 hypothetical protein BJ171DRAFT_257310 [Polychytrium aggregatum]